MYFGVWGGSSGSISFDDVRVGETSLVYVLRRPGTPLRVYDPDNRDVTYQEGKDFNPIVDIRMDSSRTPFGDTYHDPNPVTLPASTRLKAGQIIAMDYYAAFPVPGALGITMCLTEPGVLKWQTENGRAIKRALPPGGGILLAYDEMRQMNSCASCRAMHLTAGQLLAWSARQSIDLYHKAAPGAPLYFWNDMFDPFHNARNHYYYVEGDLYGSWEGLDPSVTIMNWNLGDLKNSLSWFAGLNSKQPNHFHQVIAGYYDTHDGAAAAQQELSQAAGIPGILGLMYTTYVDDYTQLENFANAARTGWPAYAASTTGQTSRY